MEIVDQCLFYLVFHQTVIGQIEKIEYVGVAQIIPGISVQGLCLLLCLLLDRLAPFAGEQSLIIEGADLPLQFCSTVSLRYHRLASELSNRIRLR